MPYTAGRHAARRSERAGGRTEQLRTGKTTQKQAVIAVTCASSDQDGAVCQECLGMRISGGGQIAGGCECCPKKIVQLGSVQRGVAGTEVSLHRFAACKQNHSIREEGRRATLKCVRLQNTETTRIECGGHACCDMEFVVDWIEDLGGGFRCDQDGAVGEQGSGHADQS